MRKLHKGGKAVVIPSFTEWDTKGQIVDIVDVIEREIELTTFTGLHFVKHDHYIDQHGNEYPPYDLEAIGLYDYSLERLVFELQIQSPHRAEIIHYTEPKTGKRYTIEDWVLHLDGEKVLFDSNQAINAFSKSMKVEVIYNG